MANNPILTGAIALIKVEGEVIGKMRSVRYQEQIRRQPVRGIGTIIATEQPVVEWNATLNCEFIEIEFQKTGIKNAIKRNFSSVLSQVAIGAESFEDQLVLNTEGVQVDIFKKVSDVVNPDGTIKPKLIPYAVIKQCLIESDSFDITDGGLAGHSQSFQCLSPLTYPE